MTDIGTAGVGEGERSFPARFGDELLLRSGQYALFYILMNFSDSGVRYFQDFGHTLLLFILIAQTTVLVLYGSRPGPRFLLSLLAPAIYTVLEIREGVAFVLNMGHMFFWFSSAVTGLIQALVLSTRSQRSRETLEFLLTLANVAIFVMVYFYFDTQLVLEERVAAGALTTDQMNARLSIAYLGPSFAAFVGDSAHMYVIAGGAILALTVGIGRIRILKLSARVSELFGRYVDVSVRDRILSRDGGATAEFRPVAVLFSDIRDFTTLSERMTPAAITDMLNEYFSWWDRVVQAHHGVIDKYIGDAVMVIFGLEEGRAACEDAVGCALEMFRSSESMAARMRGGESARLSSLVSASTTAMPWWEISAVPRVGTSRSSETR